jgi:hypothetical protein
MPRLRPAVNTSLLLFLAAAPTLAAAPGDSAASKEAAASRVITPNQFEGGDSERINQAIAAGAGTGRTVVIPRHNEGSREHPELWLLDSAILVPSNTAIKMVNCHIKLSDRCRDNFIRSANCGMGITKIEPLENIHIVGVGRVVLEGADHPRATGDGKKRLGQDSYGTDSGNEGVSQMGDWRNIGILLACVDGFRLENLHVKESHGWAISLERCSDGVIRDVSFYSTGHRMIDGTRESILNQDGIDLRQGCHDILIENISGQTGDDLIALTAISSENQTAGSTGSMMVTRANDRGDGRDDIRDIIIRNVRGFSNADHIVRFLNNRGLQIHDVILDGLIDTSPRSQYIKAAVKIGDRNYGGFAPLGDTCRLVINNVISRADHTILIGGTLSESIITNVIRYGRPGDPVTYAAGREGVRNLAIANVRTLNPPKQEK